MIEFKTGDILQADAEALVNTVNCVGIMGRGIALQFKQAFPENFKAYEAACARTEVQPGRMFVSETGFLANPKYIINFPDQAALARQEPHRGHRGRAEGAGRRDPQARDSFHRGAAAGQRPGRAGLGGSATAASRRPLRELRCPGHRVRAARVRRAATGEASQGAEHDRRAAPRWSG